MLNLGRCCLQLLFGVRVVVFSPVNFVQIQAQLDRIQRAFRHARWQIAQGKLVLLLGFGQAVLGLSLGRQNGVQAVIIGIDATGGI